ncbi:ABC transporter permease [Rubrimonas sp.]|uniref:ABC transporter permease n=1 Tax=Rubrimonas sp. TaxID=2036015 RepID=UPI002FDD47CD
MIDAAPRRGFAERAVAEGGVALLVAGWAWTAAGLPAFVLPGPLDVARAMGAMVSDPRLAGHVLTSLARVLTAVAVALALAVALAAAMRTGVVMRTIVERNLLVVLNSFPSVGWAVLGVIWFGVSDGTVVFIQTMIVLPFCLIAAIEGFRQIDPELDELGRSLTRNPWRRFAKLQAPLIAPFLIAGARIGYGIAWKIALVAELFGARTGLGALLQQAQSRADAATVFAACLVIVALFAMLDLLALRPLARRYSFNRTEV